jgi:hypothetical protein
MYPASYAVASQKHLFPAARAVNARFTDDHSTASSPAFVAASPTGGHPTPTETKISRIRQLNLDTRRAIRPGLHGAAQLDDHPIRHPHLDGDSGVLSDRTLRSPDQLFG